jgi:hypothetical protein
VNALAQKVSGIRVSQVVEANRGHFSFAGPRPEGG